MQTMKFAPLSMSVALLVSACGAGVETRISSSGTTPTEPGTYMVTLPVVGTPSDLSAANQRVAEKLSAKGFAVSETAALHLEVTLDARDAALALGSAAGPQSLSTAKRKKPLQSCKDMEYRLGVTLTRVADGAEIYRGRAAEYHCRMTVAEALPALVDSALADLGQPRGSYTVMRSAKD